MQEKQPEKKDAKPSLPRTGDVAEELLGGDNLRGEVAGCPTGLSSRDRPGDDEKSETAPEFKPNVEELKGSPITGRAR
jgi:hypothetical protein